ncbi:hypothetical protein FAEPRAM212_01221 [Faecalibacterium prausnitzii M21/2]|uniref:Uncharacterized protein n=1 Tax=Faecalibacterium prausnitzii M21/2 TaxID=411485 RepID=A8SA27_9FIRM|nr:hypothetical protein FAEPRAM212_01221 [Faecalibacterium prausnitzii M21/2]
MPPRFYRKIKNAMWLFETNHIANCTNLDYQIQPKTYPF